MALQRPLEDCWQRRAGTRSNIPANLRGGPRGFGQLPLITYGSGSLENPVCRFADSTYRGWRACLQGACQVLAGAYLKTIRVALAAKQPSSLGSRIGSRLQSCSHGTSMCSCFSSVSTVLALLPLRWLTTASCFAPAKDGNTGQGECASGWVHGLVHVCVPAGR